MNSNLPLSEHEALALVQVFQRWVQGYKPEDWATDSLNMAIKDTYSMLRELVLELSGLPPEQVLESEEVS